MDEYISVSFLMLQFYSKHKNTEGVERLFGFVNESREYFLFTKL
jgi:hypothetical protein